MKTDKLKNLNFYAQRSRKIEERRTTDPIALEKATDVDCRKAFLGDNYFCAYDGIISVYGDAYWYDGNLKFSIELNAEKERISPSFIAGMMKKIEEGDAEPWKKMSGCLSEKLGYHPDFQQCKYVDVGSPELSKTKYKNYTVSNRSTVDYIKKCETANEIREIATPINAKLRYETLIKGAEADVKNERRRLKRLTANPDATKEAVKEIDDRIKKELETIRDLGKKVTDPNFLEDNWNKIKEDSVDRGFFFNSFSITESGRTIGAGGTILSPIHDFLPDEVSQIKKVVSEAFYACTPPEHRTKNRRLSYFKLKGK